MTHIINIVCLDGSYGRIITPYTSSLKFILTAIAYNHNPHIEKYSLQKLDVSGRWVTINKDDDDMTVEELGLTNLSVLRMISIVKVEDTNIIQILMDPAVPKVLADAWQAVFEMQYDNAMVILEVENKCIYVHKTFLSERSHYFKKLFFSGMLESKQDIVLIKDCTFDTFYVLLIYLYSNRLLLQPYPAVTDETLFKIADRYDITDLVLVMQQRIVDKLTPDSVVGLLFEYGYLYDRLFDACLKFIGNNLIAVWQAENSFLYVLEKQKDHVQFARIVYSIVSVAIALL